MARSNQIDDTVALQRTMFESLGIVSRSQGDLASQLTGHLAENERWKRELVEAIYHLPLQPYEDQKKTKLNPADIDQVGKRLQVGASGERKEYLRRRFIGRLQFPTIRDRQQRIAHAHERTFHWVYDTSCHSTNIRSRFARWLEFEPGIFWVSGKPASGKSTLMKFVQENRTTESLLQRWAGQDCHLIVATYFFWRAGHPMQKTRNGLIQTLLYDTMRQLPTFIPKVFPDRWERCELFGDDLQPWSWPELQSSFKLLQDLLKSQDRVKVFFMIDGLDECEDSHGELVKLLYEAGNSTENIKMLLGSRPEQQFQDSLGTYPNLKMQDLTYPDIIAFVDYELCTQRQFQNLKRDQPHDAANLVEAIAKKASGVFLWVNLVVRSLVEGLRDGDKISELAKRLAELPPELDELYSSMLKSLEPQYLSQAAQMFQMVRSAPQQLNLLDLSFADEDGGKNILANQPSALTAEETERRHDAALRRLNSRCKGLLEVSAMTLATGSPANMTDPRFHITGSPIDKSVNATNPPGITSSKTASPGATSLGGESLEPASLEREISESLSLHEFSNSLTLGGDATEVLSFGSETSENPSLGGQSRREFRESLSLDLPPSTRTSDLLPSPRSDLWSMSVSTPLPESSVAPRNVSPRSSNQISSNPRSFNLRSFSPRSVEPRSMRDTMRSTEPVPKARNADEDLISRINSIYEDKLMNRARYRLRDGSYYDRKSHSRATNETRHYVGNLYRMDQQRTMVKQTPRTAALGPIQILEIDYLHRTAKDFIERPENWDMLLRATPIAFSPQLALLKSSVLLLNKISANILTIVNLWVWIDWCFRCAFELQSTGQTLEKQWLKTIDDIVSRLVVTPTQDGMTLLKRHRKEMLRVLHPESEESRAFTREQQSPQYHWANIEPGRYGLGANLVTLCLKYHLRILFAPKEHQGHDECGRPLLDYIWLADSETSSNESSPSTWPSFDDAAQQRRSTQQPPSATLVESLIASGADPNEWFDGATPWVRTLTKLYEFHREMAKDEQWRSPEYQAWYDVFVAYVKGGADPKADMNSPAGSYAREVFEKWDLEKTKNLLLMMRSKQRRLPQFRKKFSRS